MSPPVPALSFSEVSKRFGRIHAVDWLTLEVPPGQMAGFLGPNGAGKSTTLYMIPRLVRPTTGTIQIFGADVWRDYKRAIRSVGLTVESPAFYEYLSGRKNLALAARLLEYVSARDIDEVLERVGLTDRQSDRVRIYSTGMRQRLGIARAMLGRPRLLILDEPTNGLDPEGTHEVLSFLREKVTSEGLTIFISSHLMSEIEEFCDTVFVINRGHLVASGSVRELLKPHARIVRVTCLGKVPDASFAMRHEEQIQKLQTVGPDTVEISLSMGDSAWLNQVLLREGFIVSAIAPKQKSLKEFFLSITGPRHASAVPAENPPPDKATLAASAPEGKEPRG